MKIILFNKISKYLKFKIQIKNVKHNIKECVHSTLLWYEGAGLSFWWYICTIIHGIGILYIHKTDTKHYLKHGGRSQGGYLTLCFYDILKVCILWKDLKIYHFPFLKSVY